MIGQTVSHYKILERLGEGGMGVVYKVQDTRLDRTVALKFLPPHLSQSAEAKARFIREAKAASSLDHINICTIHDIDEADDGRLFIAMSCYEGESLKEKIERGPLPVSEVLDYSLQIAEGLSKAHKRGIVHRDIKPGNVIVTSDGIVKIVDFGLAKLSGATSLTKTDSTVGTVAYMSPEQTRSEEVDHRTDIWSLGVVMYELITGQRPFQGEYEAAVLYSILNRELDFVSTLRPDTPRNLQRIIKKSLEKEPADRYQSMVEVIEELKTPLPDYSEPQTQEKSIAVLAFTNMSADPDQEYFCDGMAEEVINALTQVRGLKVIARTSAFYFKGKDVDIEEIGRRLRVETVLEGSVRKAGNRLRITAQLINVADSTHLWSQRYDRQLEDVFAIQDEISMAIVDRLKVELLGKQQEGLVRQPTDNMEAYTLYLKGRFYRNKLSPADLQKAVSCYQQAIELDPYFARAYADLAAAYVIMTPAVFMDVLSRDEAYPLAGAAITKALALDDRLAVAHAVQGIIRAAFEWNWPGAELAFKRALELNPKDTDVWIWYGLSLGWLSRFDESLEAAHRAEILDPLSLVYKHAIGATYFNQGQYEKAIDQNTHILEMNPHYYLTLWYTGHAYLQKGEYEQSYKYYQRLLDLIGREPIVLMCLALFCASWDRKDEAIQHLEELKALSEKRRVAPTYFAWIYYYLRDQKEALHYMEQACKERDPMLLFFLIWPRPTAPDEAITWYDTFFSDPRVQAMKKKVWPD